MGKLTKHEASKSLGDNVAKLIAMFFHIIMENFQQISAAGSFQIGKALAINAIREKVYSFIVLHPFDEVIINYDEMSLLICVFNSLIRCSISL